MMTVSTLDGRQKTAPLGGSKPETLALLALVELESKIPDWTETINAEKQLHQLCRRL
jgi:hypothetical protein